jgi:predicted kinase
MGSEPNGSVCIAPRLLLIGGAPASGKTQLARQLAARFGAALCSKDEIKEILFETLASGAQSAQTPPAAQSALWSRRLSNTSFALQFHFATALLRAHRLVLLEGNFRPGEHEVPLTALLGAGSGARLIQVLCEASVATRAERLAARAADPTRHALHQDALIDAQRPSPQFLELPGTRLYYPTGPGSQNAFGALCVELQSHL